MKIISKIKEMVNYEFVLGTAAVLGTGSVIVLGLNPITLIVSIIAPVIAGISTYMLEI